MTFNTNQDAYISFRNLVGEKTSTVVAWCGSGLSAAAGLPTWEGMKSRLINALKNKAATLSPEDGQKLVDQAQSISNEANHWIAFEMLRTDLGTATYHEVIREALRPAVTAPIPPAYNYLWRLQLKGLLNLNLDRIATRAFYEIQRNNNPVEFDARKAGSLTYVLKGARPFIANLHGVMEDVSTWVFTRRDLRYLFNDPKYTNFIRSCISANTVLFVGLSVEDIAVGGHLQTLSRLGIETGPHYWVTNRDSITLDRWAESAGIRIIRYSSPRDDHSELLEMFDNLLAFVPQEDASPPPPVTPVSVSSPAGELPPLAELLGEDAETIRKHLNARAKELLSSETSSSLNDYEQFYEKYEEAIHRAWFTSTKPGRNILLGYELHKEIAQGAFGRVYRASDSKGNDLAIKVLLIDIRKEQNLIHSFRRGVRTMRILSQHNIAGMVPYLEASEIPAFAVMKWIEGPDLGAAIDGRSVEEWPDLLRIGAEIADIIRHAHLLPERVLHRDIRPSNIMLEGFYSDIPYSWHVVVLDFDLAWHRGATEKSVTYGSTKWGYLAPEQIQPLHGVSTRHAAVDSFGMGMTLYFMLSRTHPLPDQHQHKDWDQEVYKAAKGKPSKEWRSLPTRYARLILAATRHEQAKRLDMAQIKDELERLREAVLNPKAVESAEMIAEEIAARTDVLSHYQWDADQAHVSVELPTGLGVALFGDEAKRSLILQLNWISTGMQPWKQVWRWVPEAAKTTKDILESSQWSIEAFNLDLGGKSMQIRATRDACQALFSIDDTARALERAINGLKFA